MPDERRALARTYLAVCFAAFLIFLALPFGIRRDPVLNSIDREVANQLHENAAANPGTRTFFEHAKELAGMEAMIGVVLIVFGLLAYYGRYWLALAWGIAVEGAAIGNDKVLKHLFQRERPPFGKPKGPTDWSFPSGHSLRGFVMYGFLAYLIVHFLPRRWARMIGVAAMVCVVAAIGFSRIYLGKHYLSDVVGGFVFGAGWLAAWIALIELMGWRHRRQAALADQPVVEETSITTQPSRRAAHY